MQLEKKRLSIAPLLLLVFLISVGFSYIFTYSQIVKWESEFNMIVPDVNTILNKRINLQHKLLDTIRELDIDRKISFDGDIGDVFLVFERIGDKPLDQLAEVLKLEMYFIQLLDESSRIEEIGHDHRYVSKVEEIKQLDTSIFNEFNKKVQVFNENIGSFPYNFVAWSTGTKGKLAIK
ncbi:hypothetical protein HYG86_16380 [Alkalicella caledoniensis]|uniref:Uncharacterized protein n=1 Tax=Alkalicella caledoniensis TaxID=2731377 RepID=A0A7G9WC23_ALKCA|nr:hypothetical protein [Alkalicella caledoniensis]QNO16235.1 hypothetical protein HYG86_16380 [Alkalicella caledoniensis]